MTNKITNQEVINTQYEAYINGNLLENAVTDDIEYLIENVKYFMENHTSDSECKIEIFKRAYKYLGDTDELYWSDLYEFYNAPVGKKLVIDFEVYEITQSELVWSYYSKY